MDDTSPAAFAPCDDRRPGVDNVSQDTLTHGDGTRGLIHCHGDNSSIYSELTTDPHPFGHLRFTIQTKEDSHHGHNGHFVFNDSQDSRYVLYVYVV